MPGGERFERLRVLGEGGMARVWEARDRTTGTRVALKEILGEQDEHAVERLRREAAAAMLLAHPNICRALDYNVVEGDRWIAFELVEGVSLRDVIKSLMPLPSNVAAVLLDQLLAALQHAHASGVLHRDIKPRNIMVTRDGVLKLLDFGIARSVDDPTLTQTGALVGTPSYMSPEQALGERLDGRSDLFAVGILLHEMFTGASPYAANDVAVMLTRLMTTPVPPLAEVAPWASPGLLTVHAVLTAHAADRRCPDAFTARAILADDVRAAPAGLLAAVMEDLAHARSEGRRQTIAALTAEAEEHERAGRIEAALLRWDALCRFDGEHTLARSRRDALAAAHGYAFDVDDEEDLRALKAQAGSSAQPVVYRRLADLYRARRRVGEQTRWLRRYVRAQPNDTLAVEQLSALEGTKPGWRRPPSSSSPSSSSPSSVSSPGGPRLITAQSAPPGALRTRDVLEGVEPRARGRPAEPPGSSSSPSRSIVLVAAPETATRDDDGDRGRGIALGIIAALVVGGLALFTVPWLRGASAAEAPPTPKAAERAPGPAAIVDVAPLLAQARVQWSNGDALAVIQTTTTILGLEQETFIVDRREATCLRARAHARLRRTDEARLDAQRCIDWQVSSTSPELEEMRRLINELQAF